MHRQWQWPLLLLTTIGCSNLSRHTTGIRERRPGQADVTIYKLGEKPPRPYEILGKVYVHDKINYIGANYTEELILEKFRPAVAAVGADAVVGFHTQHDSAASPYQRWASGLAVRWLSSRVQKSPPPLPPYAVVVKRPVVPKGFQEFKTWFDAPLPEVMHSSLQTELEAKGYYALFPEEAALTNCPQTIEFVVDRAVNGAFHVSVNWHASMSRGTDSAPIAEIEDSTWSNFFLWLFAPPGIGLFTTLIVWPMIDCEDLMAMRCGSRNLLSRWPNATGRQDLRL